MSTLRPAPRDYALQATFRRWLATANWWRPALFLFALVMIAWLPLVGMDFWQDDRALIFKLQHPQEKTVGLFGAGLWGSGPYRGTAAVLYPFWQLFHLNPAPYFVSSLVIYWLAAVMVGWLGYQLFNRKDLAIVMASVFAVSHLGADAMLRIINSFQNLFGVIGAAITLSLILIHLKTQRISWYLAALVSFIATAEVAFIRSGGLITAVIGTHLIFAPMKTVKDLPRQLIFFIARSVPFVLAFNYIYEPGISAQRSQSASELTKLIFEQHNLKVLLTPLETLGNMVLPEQLLRILNVSYNPAVQTAIGAGALIGILVIILVSWRSHNRLARILIFGAVMVFGMFLPNWLEYPLTAFNTTHRYLTGSLLGWFAIMTAVIGIVGTRTRKHFIALAAIPVLLYIILNLTYLTDISVNRAAPSKRFYRQLQALVPQFQPGSLLYFNVADDRAIKSQFREFFAVGSMPDETAIAVYYGIDRYDIKIAESIDELLALALKNRTPPNQLYFFRYGRDGLKEESAPFREALQNGAQIRADNINLGQNDTASIHVGKIFSGLPTLIKYQYHLETNLGDEQTPIAQAARSLVELRNIMKLTSSSEWRFGEVRYAADNDLDTAWLAHRIHFKEEGNEKITASFPHPVTIGSMIWINGLHVRTPTHYFHMRTPTHYFIEGSTDNTNWQRLKEVRRSPLGSNAIVRDDFDARELRAVRITIDETASGDSPQIAELYPLPAIDQSITLPALLDYLESPQEQRTVDAPGMWLRMSSGGRKLPTLTLLKTGSHELATQLPEGFIRDDTISFGPFNLAGSLRIEDITLTIPPLHELESQNLIKQFSEN